MGKFVLVLIIMFVALIVTIAAITAFVYTKNHHEEDKCTPLLQDCIHLVEAKYGDGCVANPYHLCAELYGSCLGTTTSTSSK